MAEALLRPPEIQAFTSPQQLSYLPDYPSTHLTRFQKILHRLRYGTPHFGIVAGNPAMTTAQEVARLLHKTVPGNPPPFENNEVRIKVATTVAATKDVYAIQSTDDKPDTALQRLKLLMEGAKGAGANRVTAVVLHLPYTRQDRRDQPGAPEAARMNELEIFRAGSHNPDKRFWQHETKLKAKANLIVVDVHSEDPLKVITRDSRFQWANLDADVVLAPVVAKMIARDNLDVAIAFPDESAAKRYQKYAEVFGGGMARAAIIKKQRPVEQNNVVRICEDQESLTDKVRGKDVLMRDDIGDTLGTALQAAEKFKEDGARSVRLILTHGVFSGNALKRLDNPAIDGVIVTSTVAPRSEVLAHPKVTYVNIDRLIAEVLRRIENREPLDGLVKSTSPKFEKSYRGWRVNKERRKEQRRVRKIARKTRRATNLPS